MGRKGSNGTLNLIFVHSNYRRLTMRGLINYDGGVDRIQNTEYRIQPTSQPGTLYPEEMLTRQDKESSPWATAKINHCYFLCKL